MSSLDRAQTDDHGAALSNAMSVLRRRWLVIAGVLVLSGVANGGAILFALACTAMMALMMVGMGHGGQK